MNTDHIEKRRQALIGRTNQIIRSAGFTSSENPIPGMSPDTHYTWKRTKNGPMLRQLLIALDACGYTMVITKKETTYEETP